MEQGVNSAFPPSSIRPIHTQIHHTYLVGRLPRLAEAEGHEGQRGVRAVHQQELAAAEVVGLGF